MAGEERAGASGLTLVALDPGDVHTGFASVDIRGKTTIWRAGVLESPKDYLRPVSMLDSLFESLRRPVLGLEDFRVRPVGHQKMSRVLTPRLIGALEFMARLNQAPVYFYDPGNIERDLEGFGLTNVLDGWISWEHSRSAWRILGYMILNEFPNLDYLFDSREMEEGTYSPSDTWPSVLGISEKDRWAKALIRKRRT